MTDAYEKEPLIDAVYYSKISLNNVTLDGFYSPEVIVRSEGKINACNSSEFKISKDRGAMQ